MLGRLAQPPKLLLRALDDLHVIARHMPALRDSAEALPRSEDELADEVRRVRAQLDQLHAEIRDLREKIPGL